MLKKLLALLAQEDITTEEQALSYVDKAVKSVVALQSKNKKLEDDVKTSQAANSELTERLDAEMAKCTRLDADLKAAEAEKKTPDLDKYVPRVDYEAARNRADELQKEIDEGRANQLAADIDAAIDAAKKAGKITPASEEFYRASCAQDGGLDRFNKFVAETAPVIANPEIPKTPADNPYVALSDEELAVCRATGQSPEDMMAFKKDRGAWIKAQAKK